PSPVKYCRPQRTWRAARSMAPRATKYDRASSRLVSVRSVSPRTLLATANPTAESAAVSQSTINSADPFREGTLKLVRINCPRRPVHIQRHGHGRYVQL